MKNIFSIIAFILAIISLTTVGTLYYKRADIVRSQIIENPEVITEAISILQKQNAAKRLADYKTPLNTPFHQGFAGNPDGDVTLVELSDYNCGFCRSSLTDVERLLGEDENLRVVFRETPVLADSSKTAALWSLAAAKQGKYRAFHNALFESGSTTDDSIESVAKSVGMDLQAAKITVASQEAEDEIKQNLDIMNKVNLTGTPTFIVGDQILEGAVGYDALKKAIEAVRENESA